MKSESEMTNGERFTTPLERMNAFRLWCKKNACSNCPVDECNKTAGLCVLYWLDMKYIPTLKPCPFCGSEAHLHSGTEDNWIVCSNPECAAALVARSFSHEEEAVNAWNRRAT